MNHLKGYSPVFLLFPALFLLFTITGCRLVGPDKDDDGADIVTHSLRGKVYLSEQTGNVVRAGSKKELAEGARVWLEELGKDKAQISENGEYHFTNLLPGRYHVVAELESGVRKFKVRSNRPQQSVQPGKSAVADDISLVLANRKIIGVLYDKDGSLLPVGTNLSLWGETFQVGPESGQFSSPCLPYNATSTVIRIDNSGIFPGNRPLIEVLLPKTPDISLPDGEEQITNIDFKIPRDQFQKPISAKMILKKGTRELVPPFRGIKSKDRISILLELENIDNTAQGFETLWEVSRGSFETTPEDRAIEAVWIAPKADGKVNISIKVSALGRGYYKVKLPLLVDKLSNEKKIDSFNFASFSPQITGKINEDQQTIVLTVPHGTDLKAIVPSISYSGASISPNPERAIDFSTSIDFTVFAEDSSSKKYEVTVIISEPEGLYKTLPNSFAWCENTGWINLNSNTEEVVAYFGDSDFLTGYFWCENIGWIKLSADSAVAPFVNTSSTNWGVNIEEDGRLSGFAWSENAGWINFSTENASTYLNLETGSLTGQAWAENFGWIKLNGSTYSVVVNL